MVQANNVVKVYNETVRALDGITLSVLQGEFIAVMGPSGSGKSTLLHLLGALDRPTSGEIYIAQKLLDQVQDVDRFRSHTVGFVFQMHNLLPTLTAQENVEVSMHIRALRRQERRKRALMLLEGVGLATRASHLPAQLSGGERQRVAIARSLANDPLLLLADEPTGNLDSASGAEIMALFRRLNQEGKRTIIVVTHDPAVAQATDRIVTLCDGRILCDTAADSAYLQDLRAFKASPLGQMIQKGNMPPDLQDLGLEPLLPGLSVLLSKV
jgi:ABC-type lipoprotein export system ATPase subunit